MNKLLSFTGGKPDFNIDDMLWNDDATYAALTAAFRAFGDNYIIQGVTGTTPVTAGYVMLDGELLQVDAHAPSSTHFAKVTTYDSGGDATFNDGTARQTWQKNRATISAGSGNLTYSTATRLNEMTDIDKGFLTKVVEVGVWDMNTSVAGTAAPAVAPVHGLTYANIIGAEVLIRTDTGLSNKFPLNYYNNAGTQSGNFSIGTTTISLFTITGGIFDSTQFNEVAGYNRGWIIIKYLA